MATIDGGPAAEPRAVHAPPLEGHRLLGAEGAAALLDGDGVVDWWCHPFLDSPPQLWSLLDPHGGVARWWNATGVRTVGRPAGPSARTTLNVDGHLISCWDALVRIDGRPVLIRLARSTDGPLGVTHELRCGGFDGSEPTLEALTSGGTPPHHVEGSTFVSLELQPDRWDAVVLAEPGLVALPLDVDALVAHVRAADARAEELADSAQVITAHRERVAAGLLVLDACTDPATGAVVAAPTTSVPEVPGADRQFDYRYAWVRDASAAASVAALVGRPDVVRRHVDWLLERCFPCEGPLTPVTTTSGEPVPEERAVPGIAGWGCSSPVRVGNAASSQVQLDGAGAVAEAIWTLVSTGSGLAPAASRAVGDLADQVLAREPGPTGGIWELREPADLSSADVGRWLLYDRVLKLSRVHQPWAVRRRRRWARGRDEARDRFLAQLLPSGAAPLVYGGDDADGAGLLPIVFGLLGRHDAAAHSLVDGTLLSLGIGSPVRAVRRYPADVDDGFTGREGAFVPVCWWTVSALAQLGRLPEAHALADRLCEALPGLQPEILDHGRALGNFPLVWSHAESARALYLLRAGDVRRRWGAPGVAVWRAAQVVRRQHAPAAGLSSAPAPAAATAPRS